MSAVQNAPTVLKTTKCAQEVLGSQKHPKLGKIGKIKEKKGYESQGEKSTKIWITEPHVSFMP